MSNGITELVTSCISNCNELKEYNTSQLISLANTLGTYTKELSDIYVAVYEAASLEESPLILQETEDSFKFLESKIVFDKKTLLSFLSIIIDCFGEILPLGSVVDLKKEHFMGKLPIHKIENVRIIITHRFLHNSKDEFYFPYAGVVYPVGSMGQERMLHFTVPFIQQVVHKGYTDAQDDAYILMMKYELLCNRHIHSFSFATKEDLVKNKEA